MRLLIVSAEFPPVIGGAGNFAHSLARGLSNLGISVCVLTSTGAGGKECVRDVEVRRTSGLLNKKGLKLLPLFWAAFLISLSNRPDFVLAMTWTHDGIIAYVLKKVLGINYFLAALGSEILRYRRNSLGRALMQRVFREAASIVAISEFTKQLVAENGLGGDRAFVVNPPLDPSEWPPEIGIQGVDERYGLEGKRVLLTAARLTRRKGHEEVIRVLGQIRERYPDLVYVMTGEGEYRRRLLDLARANGVEDRVRMPGYLKQEDLRRLFARAEIYISPSLEDQDDVEGFGISLVEAAACGKPVIAGKVGGVPEVVSDGETGLLVDASDNDQVARALVSLLDNGELRRCLGERGRLKVLETFGMEAQCARLVERLREAATSGG